MADRSEAPGELELVREFVNTLDVESGRDELADDAAVDRWFVAAGLVDAPEAPGDRASDRPDAETVRRVREAFRDLLHAETHGEDDPSARAVLNDTADHARLQPELLPDGAFRLVPRAPGLAGALGRLVAIAVDAMADGTWRRLKVCDNDTCVWAFYDHSRNRSGRWCSMAVCGNRMKVRAYRERSEGE